MSRITFSKQCMYLPLRARCKSAHLSLLEKSLFDIQALRSFMHHSPLFLLNKRIDQIWNSKSWSDYTSKTIISLCNRIMQDIAQAKNIRNRMFTALSQYDAVAAYCTHMAYMSPTRAKATIFMPMSHNDKFRNQVASNAFG
jgi:hypothetical protein